MQSSHCNFVRKDTNFTHIKTLRTRIDNDFYYFCSELKHNAMRKAFFISLVTLWCVFVYAQPTISDLTFPNSVDVFGLFEMSFQLGKYDNPYDPDVIDVYAEFTAPDGKSLKVNGFYYEGYTFQQKDDYEVATASRDKGWRVRFTPNQAGKWTFSLFAVDRKGKTVLSSSDKYPLSFECRSVDTAQGFIRKANTRYLKREVMQNGVSKYQAFFPIGPNVAWYDYKGSRYYPKGIYDYNHYIDELAGSANYMRIWLSRYQYLSLYGPEFTQMNGKKPTLYFDSSLNQKDAAELDHIIAYAAKNGINVMPCFFTFGDFGNMHNSSSRWDNNPYNTVLGLKSPTLFFSDKNAKRIAKNLIRYIVARWGYATNIVCWEFWNEVNNIPADDQPEASFHTNIVKWHSEMADYIRSIDPFEHLVSTSLGTFSEKDYIGSALYNNLDIVQYHTYGNIQKAKSTEQRTWQLFQKFATYRPLYPDKPIYCGEFGFGQSTSPKYQDKDPFGFDTHNCIWASFFSGTMGPASFWYWNYLRDKNLIRIYAPVLVYCKNIPLLPDSFTPHTTVSITKKTWTCPNGIETYYLSSANEDTLYGWCQDTAFSYQALRRLTDKSISKGHFVTDAKVDTKGYVYTLDEDKRPRPCSKCNGIILPISKQAVGTQYVVRWFDGETGLEIAQEKTKVTVKHNRKNNQFIEIEFPSTIRDLKKHRINNTFGDAAFIIITEKDNKEGSNTQGDAPKNRLKFIKTSTNQSNQ